MERLENSFRSRTGFADVEDEGKDGKRDCYPLTSSCLFCRGSFQSTLIILPLHFASTDCDVFEMN